MVLETSCGASVSISALVLGDANVPLTGVGIAQQVEAQVMAHGTGIHNHWEKNRNTLSIGNLHRLLGPDSFLHQMALFEFSGKCYVLFILAVFTYCAVQCCIHRWQEECYHRDR